MDAYGLFNAIKHGDQEHQDWLKEAIYCYRLGKPIPEPRGKGSKDKLRVRAIYLATYAWVFGVVCGAFILR